jgi:hypothetical protein
MISLSAQSLAPLPCKVGDPPVRAETDASGRSLFDVGSVLALNLSKRKSFEAASE